MVDVQSLSVHELLQHYVAVLAELKRREIVRTGNNPVGDYAEQFVAKRLNLTLSANSTEGYDAVDHAGCRYQIKARRPHAGNPSRQLSPIRNLAAQYFEYLIAVIFNVDFTVQQVLQIPHIVIADYARHSTHLNGHLVRVKGSIVTDARVTDLTALFHAPTDEGARAHEPQS